MTRYNRNTIVAGIVIAVVIGGVLSYFASEDPDGLEKTQGDLGATQPAHKGLDAPPVAFNEYSLKWLGEGFWSHAAAGVIGSLVVMGLLLGLGRVLRRARQTSSGGQGSAGSGS